MTNQNDFVIDNGTGLAVRQDIQDALQALAGLSSGDSAPSTTYAFQLYANTSTDMLQIRNAANSAFIDLIQLDGTFTLEDGSAGAPALAFRDDLNTGIFSGSADEFNISTGGTERFVITSSGRCGIGELSPDAALHIKSADNILAVFESTDADALIKFQDNSTSDVISMGAIGGDDLLIRCDAGNIVFHVANNNEKVRIQNAGGISFNGDTAAANALDDYEEGTWTPTPTAGSFTSATGRYTKVGRIVVATFAVQVNTDQGASFFQINGFPFDNIASNAGENLSAFGFTDSGLDGNIVGTLYTGTAVIFSNFSGTNYRYNTSGVSGKIFRGGVTYMSSV